MGTCRRLGEDTDRTLRHAGRGPGLAEQGNLLRRPGRFHAVRDPVCRDAMILTRWMDGDARRDELMHSLMGCYKALHRAHVPVDFVNSDGLDAGGLAPYGVLYLPYCFALSAKAVRRSASSSAAAEPCGPMGWSPGRMSRARRSNCRRARCRTCLDSPWKISRRPGIPSLSAPRTPMPASYGDAWFLPGRGACC